MNSYKDILPALADVIETSQQQNDLSTKQDLLAATNRFKELLATSRKAAVDFPGGDMSLADQDQVIHALEQLRDHKQKQLRKFLLLQSHQEK